MDCRESEAILSAMHDGEPVTPDERADAEAHCGSCATCAAFRSGIATLDSAASPKAPAGTVERVMNALDETVERDAIAASAAVAEAARPVNPIAPVLEQPKWTPKWLDRRRLWITTASISARGGGALPHPAVGLGRALDARRAFRRSSRATRWRPTVRRRARRQRQRRMPRRRPTRPPRPRRIPCRTTVASTSRAGRSMPPARSSRPSAPSRRPSAPPPARSYRPQCFVRPSATGRSSCVRRAASSSSARRPVPSTARRGSWSPVRT